MIEVIAEVIIYFFVDIIFQGIILRFFKIIKTIGIIILKLMTFSGKSIKELKDSYKDSSIPYFLGFGATIGLIYFIVVLVTR